MAPSDPNRRQMNSFHVSIIGAGLGGLCLGQALKQAGIAFDIFERDPAPDSRIQGYRIRIDADGQDALASSLAPALFGLFRQSCAVSRSGGRFVDPQLQLTPGRTPASWSRSTSDDETREGGDFSANRQTLREILLCGIEEQVHFGKAFDRFELSGEDAATIRFEDGTTAASAVIVGADGVNSRVRRQLAPAAEPSDTGAVCVYGKAAADAELRRHVDLALWEGTTVVFADGFAAILDAMLFREPLPALAGKYASTCRLSAVDSYLYWAIIAPRSRLGGQADNQPLASDLVTLTADITRDWHPGLRALFAHSDAASTSALPIRTAGAEPHWPAGPATLLGDAIHVMSPAGGVGANMALRDARVLADALIDIAAGRLSLRAGLHRYETEMRARSARAIRESQEGAAALFTAFSEKTA